jgi:DNA-binding NarL/FixJ family response regulator
MMSGSTTLVDLISAGGSDLVPHPRADYFSALVVDDHPLLREEIAARLVQLGAGVVRQAASTPEARALVGRPHDLALLSLGLPGGVELVKLLRANGWPRVVVLADNDPEQVREAFLAGAQAYLVKATAPALPPPVEVTDPPDLSAREVQVLQLVADGRGNKEIAEALHLSALTVKSHLSRIGRKLHTGDRARMVLLAMRAGLVR